MAGGTITLKESTSSGARIAGKIEWSAAADTALNASKNVTAKIYVRKYNPDMTLTVPTSGTWSYSLNINGSAVTGSTYGEVLLDWVLIGTHKVGSIDHKDDGSKSITISGSVTAPSATSFKGHTTTGSGTATFDTIARASAITSASDTTLGNACSVKWTPASAAFRYKLKFAIGDWSHTTDAIHPNKTTAFTYSDYVLRIDEIASQVPKKTGKMTVTLYTYSDSNAKNLVGSKSDTFTVTVPETEETRPTVSMSLSPVSSLSAPFDSLYIQGKSKLQAALEFDTKYDADVVDSNITVDGIVYEDPYESGYLTKTGKISVKGFVKDSREHSGTTDQEITVIPYSKPNVQAASGESNIVATRCDANGNTKDSGTYLKIKAKLIYEKVISDGVQNNFGKVQYRYRAEGGLWSDWYTILDSASTTDTEVTTGALLNGALSIKTNYQVQVKAIDTIKEESQPVTLIVPSDNVYMDRPAGGKGMGLGGYYSGPGNLDIYWKTKVRGGLSLFNEEGEEISADEVLPLPRGEVTEGWNPNAIPNGIHVVENSEYPLKDSMGNVLMYNGVLIQLAATVDGSVLLQMALPTDSNSPVYRIRWYDNWTGWNSFKI